MEYVDHNPSVEAKAEVPKEVPHRRRPGALTYGNEITPNEAPLQEVEDVKNIVLTPVSMFISPECEWSHWRLKGHQMKNVVLTFSKHLRWWIGDWIIYGQTKWPDMYSQACEDWMYSYGSLRNAVWVCRNIKPDNRRENLSFEHHYSVAKFNEEEQVRWLDDADKHGWSVSELKRAIKGEEIHKKLELYVDGKNLTNPEPQPKPKVKVPKFEDYEDFERNFSYLYTQKTVFQVAKIAFESAREVVEVDE